MGMDNETKKNVFEYFLTVKGIFGRNRKVKFDIIELLQSDTQRTAAEMADIVTRTLIFIKAKPGLKWRLSETPVTLSNGCRQFVYYTSPALAEGTV